MSKKKKQRVVTTPRDRNFSDIAGKFKNNIYGTTKGKIREAVLQRDLDEALATIKPKRALRVLDVGGGQGQLALYLALQGHLVTLIDVSEEMLGLARERAVNADVSQSMVFIHAPLQAIPELDLGQFDLVLCHAVLEWVVDQQSALSILRSSLAPEGILSLMYFNKSAQRLANMVYGNFDYVANGLKVKQKVGLSPNQPLESHLVDKWLQELDLNQISKTGVRCFHDYLRELDKAESQFNALLDMELKYNRTEPYASIGRYTHLLLDHKRL
ncbi:methyltransferase [Pseudoalteromonas luteoviolacea]|uniref:tRNA 5-carboxymethoxyuridine methyltransferase n=1 Tax=Pseudoalteromonas luteoviolacea TaxID=43657 RepID=A0A1C0TNF6_9GAMM|nr:methyltransferase domain-containing protein [Pseudoalteromonas luteoviolacea]MBQ4813003.1 methyltransferase domain-containing protein [Pseudoalteromonas luteoviolacea]OCQ20469.1 methyltransferase [Pseudoalteromonas luteoviolacea]